MALDITLLDTAYLIRCYVQGFPNENLDEEQLRSFDRLQNARLVKVDTDLHKLISTERGQVYCEALRQVPLPEQQWVMPK